VDHHALIRERLLDGRTNFDRHELHQLVLLFGAKANVRAALGRDVLDVRIIDDETKRPRRRELVESDNLLLALRHAVAFLSDALANEVLALEDLKQTDGGVDYLTIREMLVNQIIHQDYYDSRTSAQIELYADKITLTNAGYSLVPMGELLEGGRSQSRNPLIARALRAIGFAELSGSGIRALVRALRIARRKAPRFTSDDRGNTFRVTLEWTDEAPDVDAFWMELVGARLTSEQAHVLNALAELPSATLVTLESTTRIPLDELIKSLDFLVLQVLVEHDEASYRLAQHLREKLG
jgi:predicted HTH transcriptional regulator